MNRKLNPGKPRSHYGLYDLFRDLTWSWQATASVVLFVGFGWLVFLAGQATASLSAQADRASISAAPITDTTAHSTLESTPQTGTPFTLTVLHTNDTWGYVDPCG